MTLSIRNRSVEDMARALARKRGVTITRVMEMALLAEIKRDRALETPSETAARILAKRGLSFPPGRDPVPQSAYYDLDHDLTGDDD